MMTIDVIGLPRTVPTIVLLAMMIATMIALPAHPQDIIITTM
jgi:hypothetical protein